MVLGAIAGAVIGGIFGFGQQQQSNNNADKVQRDLKDHNRKVDKYNWDETQRKYDFAVDGLEIRKRNDDRNIAYQEASMQIDYQDRLAIRDYEQSQINRAFQKSAEQRFKQNGFNSVAEQSATRQQLRAHQEAVSELMFDETYSLLDYFGNTTGAHFSKAKQLADASFNEASSKLDYQKSKGSLNIKRNAIRAESQISTQNAIVEGMKAAGKISAAGGQGRSAAKAMIGVLAESGARQSAIANTLMFAENEISLNLGALEDQMILDQTMVLASKNAAINQFNIETSKLDAAKATDSLAFDATRENIDMRNKFVLQQIQQARMQADLEAEAQMMLYPDALPPISAPLALPRPEYQDIFEPTQPPETYTAAAAYSSPWLAGASGAMPYVPGIIDAFNKKNKSD